LFIYLKLKSRLAGGGEGYSPLGLTPLGGGEFGPLSLKESLKERAAKREKGPTLLWRPLFWIDRLLDPQLS